MPFTVEDFEDLMHLLSERPDWQERLRRQILSDDFLQLPGIVRDLAEAQHRTEERLDALTERVDTLTQRVDALAERMEDLVRAQGRMELALEKLIGSQDRLQDQFGNMKGTLLEFRYREHCPGYFGRWLRRPRVLPLEDLEDAAEDILSRAERDDALLIDLVIQGRLRPPLGDQEVLVAVEVSSVIDESAVERASRRAGLLRRLGRPAIPAVAGEKITLGAEDRARRESMAVLQDGRHFLWDEAARTWAGVDP